MELSTGINLLSLLAAALVMGVLVILTWLLRFRRRARVSRAIGGTIDDGPFMEIYQGNWRGRAVRMSRWKEPKEVIPRWEVTTSFAPPLPLDLEIAAGWGLSEAHPAHDQATVAAALDESLCVRCEDDALVLSLRGHASLRRVLADMLLFCNKLVTSRVEVRVERRWDGSDSRGPGPVLEQQVAWAEDLERILASLQLPR